MKNTFISIMRLSNKPIAFSMSWDVVRFAPKSPISNGSILELDVLLVSIVLVCFKLNHLVGTCWEWQLLE